VVDNCLFQIGSKIPFAKAESEHVLHGLLPR